MAKFKTTKVAQSRDSLQSMRREFARGTEIFKEGELGFTMYVIESGEVEIRKNMSGEDQILARFGQGDFFGEMCMLEEESLRTASAVASEDVVAVEIEQSAFVFMLESNPEIAVRMMRKLVVRLRHTTRLLEESLGYDLGYDDEVSDAGMTSGPQGTPDPTVRLKEVTTGMTFPLSTSIESSVGRVDPVTGIHPDVDLTPVDTKRSISRRHARMRREEDGTFSALEDVGTMNGTYVNGTRLTAGEPHPVESGDSVVFGTIRCVFEVDQPAPT